MYFTYSDDNDTIEKYRTVTDTGATLLIGKWLFHQRDLYERGMLRNDRFGRLQSLVNEGLLHWDVKKRQTNAKISEDVENIWNNHYETLLAYGREHGHYNVPQKLMYTENDGQVFGLGQWLHKQKFQKQNGQLAGNPPSPPLPPSSLPCLPSTHLSRFPP